MDSKTVRGFYFDGRSSSARPATLRVEEGSVRVTVDEESLVFSASECRERERLGSLARAIELPGGGHFESGDLAGMDALFSSRRLVHTLEGSWRAALTAAAAFAGFLALTYFVLLPAFSRELSAYVPQTWKENLSSQTRGLLEKTYLEPTALSEAEQARAERIFAEASKEEKGLRIHLRKSSTLGANAFALPDGTIYVTDALMRLVKTDDELLGVLFHEAAHVRLNHSMAELIANSALTLALFTVAGGDWTSLPLVLLGSSYSRVYEEEADAYAATKLRARGLSPAALGRMLERMEKEGEKYKYFSLLSSHPATASRVRKLKSN